MRKRVHNEGVVVQGGSVNAEHMVVGRGAKLVVRDKSAPKVAAKERKLAIFLSYSSEHLNIADKLALALSQAGHAVFFDRTTIPPGEDFNAAILSRIEHSNLFVFLISPSAIKDGSYARSELRFARKFIDRGAMRLLPVMVVQTEVDLLPNILKSVNILRAEGNLVAEVVAAVSGIVERGMNRVL